MAGDESTAAAQETATVETTQFDDEGTNLSVGYEEGPHLNDPELRRLKREQMKTAGMKLSDPHLTEDMKAILREKA